MLCAGPGEVLHERWRGATVYNLGGRKRRMGASIGPHNYDQTGVWTPDAPHNDSDAWNPIDLKSGISARSGVALTMFRCGYEIDIDEACSITFKRGGASVTMTPQALAWVNGDQVQVIAEPRPGRPMVVDEDGVTVRDAYGPGIHWRAAFWPDNVKPCVIVDDPQALVANPLTAPYIANPRLAKILSVGWSNGNPDRDQLFRRYAYRQRVADRVLHGRADEVKVPIAPMPLRASEGDAMWFAGARAWDDEQGWPVRSEWQQFGADLQVVCSLPIEAVLAARGALLLDDTMAEQQVGASADDSSERGLGSTWVTSTSCSSRAYTTTASDSYRAAGIRWQAPIPVGATITSASVTVNFIYDDPWTTLYFDDTGDAANFVTTAGIIARPRTAHGVSWQADNLGTGQQTTPDLSSPLQDVVSRGDWLSGNSLVMLSIPNADINRWADWTAYDGNPALAAKLNATYTVPAAGGGIPPHLLFNVAHGGL